MLGIGFIITHFVAMQKPQQRKYHSSCDRSVHRGTAHGKQRVKVCKRKTPHLLMRSFLPPCGDKLQCLRDEIIAMMHGLSSPCGDKLQWWQQSRCTLLTRYRPLAGISCNRCKLCGEPIDVKLSSPCGDKLQSVREVCTHWRRLRLSSPCGDKLQSKCSWLLCSSWVIVPLRG